MTIEQEREAVKLLGEAMGYGNMMLLASDLWKEMLIQEGYPISGAFVPALPCDVIKRTINPPTPEGRPSCKP